MKDDHADKRRQEARDRKIRQEAAIEGYKRGVADGRKQLQEELRALLNVDRAAD
jgi:hypothetical protein